MSQAEIAPATPALPRRIDLVDLGRGIALLAMFVFHFAYDLSYFRLIDVDVPVEPGWRWFARLIAGSFLTLVGISLVLATRAGLNRAAFLKRLAMVAGAAALVSLATWFAMRDSFIFFGILHHVAVASVLGLAFLRLPSLVVALSAILAFALPLWIDLPLFDAPWLVWLGLSQGPVNTADFVPVFPWFGCVLAGILLGRLMLARPAGWMGWRATSRPARLLVWGGRHSLLVYLVHQPVFISALMLATQMMPLQSAEERPFLISCQRSCMAAASTTETCQALCSCTVDGLKQENLWSKVLANAMSPTESARTGEIARACLRRP